MDNLIASFAANPGLRLLVGLVFFGLLGGWFFRQFAGRGKIVFLGLCLVLVILFALSPGAQLMAFVPLVIFLAWSLVRPPTSRPAYRPAETLVEGGGLKRGLTAPEAAVVMETPLNRVLGVVILGLLRKEILGIQKSDPLTLQLLPPYDQTGEPDPQERTRRRAESAQYQGVVLHPYDDPFIEQLAAAPDLPLGDVNFTAATRALLRQTARRVRGHNLAETRVYYQKHLGRARHDVEFKTSGPEAQRTREQFFEWLVLDEEFAALYQEYLPKWLSDEQSESETGGLVDWVEKMVQELGASIPAGGLQVKTAPGEVLAIGGTDPISAQFFDQILREL